ncbi:MAG: hypothetical protein JSR39_05945, partial [Verrucomicrobia bacterium]|nr:hypothetical protein [Verrucomicrobiota bacterium]
MNLTTSFLWCATLCKILCSTSLFSEEYPYDSFIADEEVNVSQEPLYRISEISLLYEYGHREPISIKELNQVEIPLCEQDGIVYARDP